MHAQLLHLQKRYGAKLVVDDVTFEVSDGEFLVILGPSGCGKTTTLRLLAGLETPDAGTIAIGGRVMSDPAGGIFVPSNERSIGMVFQSYAIWPHLTVFQNVAYPLKLRHERRETIARRVGDVLELVGLTQDAHRSATALSGGQMQRVALARAIVYNPTLLLFDEPLSNLDLKLRERLRVELKQLQVRTGLTSVYVTHDQTEAVELGDRVVVMNKGRVIQIATPSELYRRPKTRFVAEFIGTANILRGTVDTVSGGDVAMVRLAGGHMLSAHAAVTVRAGDAADVVIHPEDCLLVPQVAEPAANQWSTRVTARRFQGTSTRYTVDWNGSELDVVVLGTAAAQLEVGAGATLSIAPDAARIVAPDDPETEAA